MITTPEPGIYENIPFVDYLAWDAISNSMLGQAKRSLARYRKARREGFDDETDAMKFGTLCHTGKLEPTSLLDRYVIRPRFEDSIRRSDGGEYKSPRSTDVYRDEVAAWKKTIVGKTEVTEAELANMTAVVKALAKHSRACEFLEGDGPVEVSFLWIDPHTGLRCKGRTDKLKLAQQTIGDLKTTIDIDGFENTIPKRGYHRQGAFYIDGIETLKGTVCCFALVAAESVDPFGVRAAPVSAKSINVGRDEYKSLLASIAAAQQTDVWPGPESPDEWHLPGWAMPREAPVELDWSGVSFSQ